MRSIYICNTYMQIISAVQIRRFLFPEGEADILISDHSQGANNISQNIGNEGIFDRVKFCRTQYYVYDQGVLEDFIDVFRGVSGKGKKYDNCLWNVDNTYDVLFYFNLEVLLYFVYDISVRNGKKPECIRMEEGIAGYHLMLQLDTKKYTRLFPITKIRGILKRGDVFSDTRKALCFSPQLFPQNDHIIAYPIPNIDKNDPETVSLFKRIFSYEPSRDFPQKILFFGSSADVDGYGINESEYIISLTHKTCEGNILLKKHPRDGRNVYAEAGLNVMESSTVPWEIMQLTTDFSRHIFVTIGSSSLLNAASMFDDNVETYMLYPLFKNKDNEYYNLIDNLIRPTLKKLQMIGKCKNIRIIESENEWDEILKKELSTSVSKF